MRDKKIFVLIPCIPEKIEREINPYTSKAVNCRRKTAPPITTPIHCPVNKGMGYMPASLDLLDIAWLLKYGDSHG